MDIIFQTLPIYDDRHSTIAVDDLIVKGLGEAIFMKYFATSLIQSMEKHVKIYSPVGCYKLLKWSFLLLRWSQFASASKNGFSRLVCAQASLCQILMQGSYHLRGACKKLFVHLFTEVFYD